MILAQTVTLRGRRQDGGPERPSPAYHPGTDSCGRVVLDAIPIVREEVEVGALMGAAVRVPPVQGCWSRPVDGPQMPAGVAVEVQAL